MERSPYVRFYDFFADFDHDLDFYRELAVGSSGVVLELGCGTGRVAIPLARAGAEVVGLDRSGSMLEQAAERALAEGVTDRIEWIEGEMTSWRDERRFSLVLCPANTLLTLGSRTAQELVLATARHHLAPGGRLALDLFHPAVFLAEHPPDGRIRLHRQQTDAETGRTLRWTSAVRHSPAAQLLVAANRIEAEDAEGIQGWGFEEILKYCHPHELELLLEKEHFEIEDLYGWFDRRPFDDTSRKMVVVARRAS